METLTLFQIVAWLVAAVLLFIAAKLLWKSGWFMAWLRGNSIAVFIVLALLSASLAIDLRGYSQWPQDETIARLSLVEFKPQIFIARVSIEGQDDQTFELRGDQWQIDARIIGWRGAAQSMGLTPLYRFGRLSGRYLTLEQERSAEHSVYELGSSRYAIDTWRLLHSLPKIVPWLRPQYGGAVFMPMAHNAQYEIVLSGSALIAKPLSSAAITAVDNWL
ncbi:MAG: hypothetical protein AB8B86_20980 [Pseudomonadales bacterium]